MPKVTFVTSEGTTTVEAEAGKSILTAAQNNDVPLRHACGGNGCCTTCMVEVKENQENLNDMTEAEKQMMLPDEGNIRLGCQAKVTGDVTVEVVM